MFDQEYRNAKTVSYIENSDPKTVTSSAHSDKCGETTSISCSNLVACKWCNVQILLLLIIILPSMAIGPERGLFNRGQAIHELHKNFFSQKSHTDVTAQVGGTAQLPCRISSSMADGMVSWVRSSDYHLLTVGRLAYSSDVRFDIKVSSDGCDWTLAIRWVEPQDAGLYECQVSSHPPQALMVNLSVVEAHAEILGESERFIHSGSSLLLLCLLKEATEPPVFVFWYRGDRMINYDQQGGVTVDNTEKFSKLFLSSVTREEEGNYTCLPSNAAPASVSVTVVQRENPAGLQQETNTKKDPSSGSSFPSSSSSSSSSSFSSASSSKSSSAVNSSNGATVLEIAVISVTLLLEAFVSLSLLHSLTLS